LVKVIDREFEIWKNFALNRFIGKEQEIIQDFNSNPCGCGLTVAPETSNRYNSNMARSSDIS
jgi:hypothetical protein